MKYFEQALKLAIEEGGYKKPFMTNNHISTLAKYKTNYSVILLDIKFWKALGKALGWHEEKYNNEGGKVGWFLAWHQMINHLAEDIEGKDIDSFFKHLLGNKK